MALFNLSIEKNLDKVGLKTKGKVYDLAVVEPYRKAIGRVRRHDKGKTVQFRRQTFLEPQLSKNTPRVKRSKYSMTLLNRIRNGSHQRLLSARHGAMVAGDRGRYSLYSRLRAAQDHAEESQRARRPHGTLSLTFSLLI
jgi:hypothetical protein